jgi:hypothetical protein
VNVFDGFVLAIVWSESSGTRVGLRRRHLGSGYHLPEVCKVGRSWRAICPAASILGGLSNSRLGIANEFLVAGVRIDFKNTESVALGVDEVALPAGLRNGELR